MNELLRGRRAVSSEMALRLSRLFGIPPEFWLSQIAKRTPVSSSETSQSRFATSALREAALERAGPGGPMQPAKPLGPK
jgi:plasmid maintenance system antidote protein VapI